MADDEQVEAFVERLSSESYLRDEFRESPAEVVERFGIELNDEQREKLEGEDWSAVADDDLVERLSARGAAAWL